jgi:hypothetical protein
MAFSCTCSGKRSPVAELEVATAVFAGRVREVTPSGREKKVVFEVETAWKGVSKSIAVVSTPSEGGVCGNNFVLNEKYLVYAFGTSDLETDICTRTGRLSDAHEDLSSLGAGIVHFSAWPDNARSSIWLWSASTLGLVVVIGAVWLLLRFR